MKKKSKMILTLSANILMIFAALVISITSLSIAWFSMNNEANANKMRIEVYNKELVKEVNFYSIAIDDSLTLNDNYYYFNKTKVSCLEMQTYSIFDNRYQALVEIVLNDSRDNIIVKGNTDTSYYVGNIPSSFSSNEALKQNGNPLSNIVKFYSFGTSLEGLPSVGNYYFLNTSNINPEFKSFTNLSDKNNKHIDNDIVISQVSNCEIIYILIDYYQAAIDDIYETYLGSDLTSGGVNIEYTSDFSFIIEEGVY